MPEHLATKGWDPMPMNHRSVERSGIPTTWSKSEAFTHAPICHLRANYDNSYPRFR